MSGFATWQIVAVFVVSAAVLVRSGFDLARNADEIVARTRLTAVFVGGLFMAVATSLPEAVTGVAATLEGSPDLAVGDLFGSSMANMAILALLDLAYRGSVWPSVGLDHARVGSLAIVLTGLAVLGVLDPGMVQIGPVGLMPLAIAGIYVAALAWFRRSPSSLRALRPTGPGDRPGEGSGNRSGDRRDGEVDPQGSDGVRRVAWRFGAATAVILVSAPLVASSAREIANRSGVSETFVGVALLAITTSLPELIASFAALRIGAYDLAVGNLFGSNAANMAMLLFVDLAYGSGSVLGAVSPAQAVAGVGAIVMMALAIAAIVHGSETRIWRLEPDAVVLLLAYIALLFAVARAA